MILRQSPRTFDTAGPTPPLIQDLALMGDSLTAFGTSPMYWINGLNGGPLRIVANLGVSGEKIEDLTARIGNASTAGSPGIADLSLGWLAVMVGTNNVRAGESAATVSAKYDALFTAGLALADRIIVLSVPPIKPNALPSSTLPADYNALLVTKCDANPSRLSYVDVYTSLQTGGALNTAYYDPEPGGDYIHLNAAGVAAAGIYGATDVSLAALLAQYTSPLIASALDVYPAQPQWITNPLMSGTGGTANFGFSGTVVDGWTVSGNGVNVGGTCSIQTDFVGDNPWQRVVPTQGNTGSSIAITVPFNGRSITSSDPVTIDSIMQIRTNSLDTTKIGNFSVEAFHGDGSRLIIAHQLLCLGYGVISNTVVFRSARPRTDSASHAGATYNFAIPTVTCGPGASVGSFDFRLVSARG